MDKENQELLDEITKWTNILQENNNFIEYAFIKIYIKFENLFVGLVKLYSTGYISSSGYTPNRRLAFSDEIHFKNTINKNYLGLDDDISRIIDNVFDEPNPFSFFVSSAHQDFFKRMKFVRNFLAHESAESKEKYISSVLNSRPFIEPAEFLKSNVSKQIKKSNLSFFIDLVTLYSETLISGNN